MLTILKHAKNFVGDRSDKPIFQGVHFTGDMIAVTNTRVLVFRTNFPSEKKTIHYKTGVPVDGIYPEVARCVPRDVKCSFEFKDLNSWIKTLKIACMVRDGCDPRLFHGQEYPESCELKIGDQSVSLLIKNENTRYESTLEINLKRGGLESIGINPKSLLDVLMFFKDSGVTVVTMGFTTSVAPMKLTTDKDVMAVITPVRL